jgi:hypothetical protein
VNLDELEFELRKLPGIRWAAFSELGDRLLVQLHAIEDPTSDLALRATRLAAHHSDLPVAVEVVRWRHAPGPETLERAPLANGSSGASRADPAPRPQPGTRDSGL